MHSSLLSINIYIKIFTTVIQPDVLYGCETWSHIEEGRRQRVFENKVLRRIFRLKRDEIIREW
jgi:hypothetical protein